MPASSGDLQTLLAFGELLDDAATALARSIRREWRIRHRRRRGATLRPGADTPLWLVLVAAVRPHLRPYGHKSRLARELGLDPSRITEFFVRQSAMPDAERTLRLLVWLARPRPRRTRKAGSRPLRITQRTHPEPAVAQRGGATRKGSSRHSGPAA